MTGVEPVSRKTFNTTFYKVMQILISHIWKKSAKNSIKPDYRSLAYPHNRELLTTKVESF